VLDLRAFVAVASQIDELAQQVAAKRESLVEQFAFHLVNATSLTGRRFHEANHLLQLLLGIAEVLGMGDHGGSLLGMEVWPSSAHNLPWRLSLF
jgi:hypothetical protein